MNRRQLFGSIVGLFFTPKPANTFSKLRVFYNGKIVPMVCRIETHQGALWAPSETVEIAIR